LKTKSSNANPPQPMNIKVREELRYWRKEGALSTG
jgi:hypothetical protein